MRLSINIKASYLGQREAKKKEQVEMVLGSET
jgi:hypothetical protein